MGHIWVVVMLASVAVAVVGGRTGDASQAVLSSGTQAVSLLITLLATMTLWSGLMEILMATGDVARLGKVFRRMLRPLFPGLEDDEAWNVLSMNLAANLMGLGNAATPAGIAAAQRLSKLGGPGLRALAMLLVLDNAGIQLMPTTVITLRQAAGAKDPADIWGMTMLISGTTMVIAAVMMLLIQRGGTEIERRDRYCDRSGHRVDPAQRRDDGR